MRSHRASTGGSARVRRPAAFTTRGLLEGRQEVDELVELLRILLLQPPERRHRRGRVQERASDRAAPQTCADVRQGRARAGVAVLADLVAGEAARRGDGLLALLVLRRDLEVD